jgi:Domain of unknown function (DUF4383)
MSFNRTNDRARVDTRTGDNPARPWMLAVGIALLLAGLLGFVDNPLVGQNGLFMTGTVHNVIHIVTGLAALAIGAGLHGRDLARATIAYGVVYALVLVATLVSPDLFGILDMPVNTADHVLHLILAAGSIAAGYATQNNAATA